MPGTATFRSVKDVVNSLLNAKGRDRSTTWGGVTFLLGAGCSHSAGIPMAVPMARAMALRLASTHGHEGGTDTDPDVALEWLKSEGKLKAELTWPQVYGAVFEHHYKDATTQRRIIAEAIDLGTGINWAHACLGELVRRRFVHTVLTTNFDQLALDGMVRGDILPVVADGIDALHRIEGQPMFPQLVHIHGTRNTYHLRNSPGDVTSYASQLPVVRVLSELLRSTPALVVIGYGGGDEGIMSTLIAAAESLAPAPPVYWVLYSDDATTLTDGARRLLAHSSGGGVILGQDADGFFGDLMTGLKLEGPGWLVDPVAQMKARAKRVARPSQPLLAAVVDRYLEQIDALKERRAPAREKRLHQFRTMTLAGESTDAVELLKPDLLNLSNAVDLEALGDAAYDSGLIRTESDHLRVAIDVYRRAGNLDVDRAGKARVLNKLGNALQAYAKRMRDDGLANEAIEAYKSSIALRTGPDSQRGWAASHVNLGAAYRLLSQLRNDAGLLSDAMRAYTSALTVYTAEASPIEWATALSNLSAAQFAAGQRTGHPQRYEEAVESCLKALEVLHPSAQRPEWLNATFNLANALLFRSHFDTDLYRIDQALTRYKEGLRVLGHHSANELLAGSFHNGLGAALLKRGVRIGDKRSIAAAIDEFNTARLIRRRDRVPYVWASTQGNLAEARLAYAMSAESPEWLLAADSNCLDALEVIDKTRQAPDWAYLTAIRGCVQAQLGTRAAGSEGLQIAIQLFDRALAVFTETGDPDQWADVSHARAATVIELASRTANHSLAHEAEAILGRIASLRRRHFAPIEWAATATQRARALLVAARLEVNLNGAELALAAAAEAADILAVNVSPVSWCELQIIVAEALLFQAQRTAEPAAVDRLDKTLSSMDALGLRDLAPLAWAHNRRLRARWAALAATRDPAMITRARAHCDEALDMYRRSQARHDEDITLELQRDLQALPDPD